MPSGWRSVVAALDGLGFFSRGKSSSDHPTWELGMNEPNSEQVAKAQKAFEDRLRRRCKAPYHRDHNKEAYIYWNLMGQWYSKLAIQFRDDEEILSRLKRDWLFYLDILERLSESYGHSIAGGNTERQNVFGSIHYAEHCLRERLEDSLARLAGDGALTTCIQ
jgi:hypothetical protein